MPASPRSARPRNEEGFILIAAIWLLILAGSIAAILMARSLSEAREMTDAKERLEQKLALESAIETVFADRLFNGPRSRWWLLPADGVIRAGDRRVKVRVTSESGRLDMNEADLALLDTALRGFGLDGNERGGLIVHLQRLRSTGRRLRSLAEMEAVLAAATADRSCFKKHLTIASGLAEPRANHMSAELAKALGEPTGSFGPVAADAGAALRVEASLPAGASLMAIGRLTSQTDRPLSISAWRIGDLC